MGDDTKQKTVRGNLDDFLSIISFLSKEGLLDDAHAYLKQAEIDKVIISTDVYEEMQRFVNENTTFRRIQGRCKCDIEIEW